MMMEADKDVQKKHLTEINNRYLCGRKDQAKEHPHLLASVKSTVMKGLTLPKTSLSRREIKPSVASSSPSSNFPSTWTSTW